MKAQKDAFKILGVAAAILGIICFLGNSNPSMAGQVTAALKDGSNLSCTSQETIEALTSAVQQSNVMPIVEVREIMEPKDITVENGYDKTNYPHSDYVLVCYAYVSLRNNIPSIIVYSIDRRNDDYYVRIRQFFNIMDW